jgi:hypothetical protein
MLAAEAYNVCQLERLKADNEAKSHRLRDADVELAALKACDMHGGNQGPHGHTGQGIRGRG